MVDMSRNVILQGNALDVLRTLPTESVQTVVTSPPYYALRNYGLPPSIWGGSDNCEHIWGDWQESHDEREARIAGKTRTTDRFYGDGSRRYDGNHQKHTAGTFCQKCGAWLGCLGLEPHPSLYVEHLVMIFREVKRVLRKDGTFWLNLGDSYGSGEIGRHDSVQGRLIDGRPVTSKATERQRRAGFSSKQKLGMPWRAAFALQDDGWILRSDIIWHKPNCMPESVTDRPTSAHEYLFLFAKSERYTYDSEATKEGVTGNAHVRGGNGVGPKSAPAGSGIKSNSSFHAAVTQLVSSRNKRSVWSIATSPFAEAHFATFPPALVEPCILAGTTPCACEICGAPWRRIVDRSGGTWEERKEKGAPARYGLHGAKGIAGGGSNHDLGAPVSFTLGWEPTCRCKENTGAGRCVVLDPFSGAGTVALVASHLGRDYLGVEMNPAYIEMAEQRIRTGGKRQEKQLEAVGIEQPTLWAVS